MTKVYRKWLSAILALLMIISAIPASLAEEVAEISAVAEEPTEVYTEPVSEPVAEVPAPQPEPEPVPGGDAPAAETPAEAPAQDVAPEAQPTSVPTAEPVFLVRLQLGETPNLIYVPYGTLEADLPLPGTLSALYSNGTTGQVSVNWYCLGDSLGGVGYVSNHENGEAVFYFQPTPVGALCDPAMMLPMVTVAYESVPMAVTEHPDIEIAGDTITVARGATVTTDDIANEPGYDPAFLILNRGTIEAGEAELYNPINGGTINGGVYHGDVDDAPQYVLRINGGTFYGEVGDEEGEDVDAYVYIRGGEFHNTIKARNLVISGGTFMETSTVYLWTVGSIYGGKFYGTVINHLGILNGPETVPEFYGLVVNAQSPYGQIYGGRFYGQVDNSAGGKITSGAEFIQGQINNSGTIDAGTSTFSADVRIINEAEGKILGGSFGCSVYNSGSISGGTYNAEVVNAGMISGGAFYAAVSNEGTIAGADIFGALTYNTGTISTAGITVDVDGGKVVISSGTTVSTDLIMNAIDDAQEASITVIENNGTITEGTASISYKVDNVNGTIAGGTFNGYITGGAITGGTFNGDVDTDGKSIVTITDGVFNGNIGNAQSGYTFVSGGTFNAGVAARNLVISGGTFRQGSKVVLGAVGGISGGTFDGTVTSHFGIEGGTFNGTVENYGTIFGGTFNGTIDNHSEITYISEYDITTGFDGAGNAVKANRKVPQTWLNGTVNDFGGCIYGPVMYGEGAVINGAVYAMVTIIENGDAKLYQGKEFLRDSNVLESLKALDAQQNVNSVWTRADGSEIGAADVFSADVSQNEFKRETNWMIRNGVLELSSDVNFDNALPVGSYKSVHVCKGVTISGGSWSVPVVNDGAITGGTFNAAVENNGTITGAALNSAVRSNKGSGIAQSNFGPEAQFPTAPAGSVELNYTVNGETRYASYNALMYSVLKKISNGTYEDWYVYNREGQATLVDLSTHLTLDSRDFRVVKRVTPEIEWPTASVLPYGEKLSSSKLISGDRFGTFSWKTPNVVPAGAGKHSYTVVYKPTYTSYDYTGVELEKDIEVEVKRNAAVIVISNGQSKTYGSADPKLNAMVTGLKSGDTLNYALKRAPGEDAGTYVITAELGDNPNYDVTVVDGKFTISQKSLASTASGTLPDQTYTGQACTPKPAVIVDGVTLVEGKDYTLSYANNINVGTGASVQVKGIGNYTGTRTLSFKIVKCSATIAVNSAVKELGAADPALTASVTGVANGAKLNYSLNRAAGENAGTYTISVSLGSNPNYDIKTVNGTLTIKPKQLPAPAAVAAQTYAGAAISPKPVVKDGSKTLTEGTDYTVAYANNVNAGTATITITGKGNYTGSQKVSFTINKANAEITANAASKPVGGADPALTATVTGTVNGQKLNYTLTRAAGEAIGSYTITVTPGSNPNYNVTVKSGTLTILPEPSSVAFSSAQLTLETGKTAKLTAELKPAGTMSQLSYTSSDTAVATVAADGTVKAVKPGTATITVKTANNRTATCQLTVKPVAESITLGSGEKRTLTPADRSATSFASSNDACASVDANGTVTAKIAGSVVITASANGVEMARWNLTVTAAPDKLGLSASTATLGVGETLKLTAAIANGAASEIAWSSNKASVATVDANGVITAKQAGSATITGQTYNGKKATCKVTVKKAPTAISLSVATATLGSGDSLAVKTTLSSGSVGSVTYESTNASIATISNGRIIAGATAGTATITAKTYNGKTATCKVTVMPAPKSISIGGDLTLGVKQSVALNPVLTAGSKATLTYSTSDKKVVTVTAAGKLTAVKAGTATITVTAHNGVTASIKVTVKNAPSKVTLSAKTAKLSVGQSLTLTAAIPNGSVSGFTWSSSKTSVATVDANGVVTAKKAGTVTITVKTYNGKKATCKITVK